MSTIYETDFNLWLKQTANDLREQHWHELDITHLIEEIEGLSKSEKRSIVSQLARLLLHLLKWQYQPERRSDSWLDSITDARIQIAMTLADSPSLKFYPAEQLDYSYQLARRNAARQTGLSLTVFPEHCPYTLENILQEYWLPGGDPLL